MKDINDELAEAKDKLLDIKKQILDYQQTLHRERENLKDFYQGDLKMNIVVIASVIAFIVGAGGAGVTVHKIHKNKDAQNKPVEQVAEKQIEVQLQLTDLDLIKEPCSTSYIEKHSDLLCREMFCLMQTRGLDSQTSGNSCEEIMNIQNSIKILEQCETEADKEDCYRLFRERK